MHIPDGFIEAPVSAAGAVVAAGGVALAARKAAADLDDRAVPLAGLTSAYVFAMQMLNFPVAAGTSGHLVGGCLAAMLVGPWLACISMAVVIVVQALVFADGGLSAIGLNMILMGVVPVLVATGATHLARVAVPATRRAVMGTAAVAAWASVVASALVFTAFFAIGGAADVSLRDVTAAMVGVHALIGIGEAVITAATLGAVIGTRPDLVHAARHVRRAAATSTAPPTVGAPA